MSNETNNTMKNSKTIRTLNLTRDEKILAMSIINRRGLNPTVAATFATINHFEASYLSDTMLANDFSGLNDAGKKLFFTIGTKF